MVPSRPYAEMTLTVMEAFGITGSADDTFTRFTIPHGAYRAGEYYIELKEMRRAHPLKGVPHANN